MTILKHPLDWAKQKKTPDPLFKLGCAVVWHTRLALEGTGQDVPADMPRVDPLGVETDEMSEQDYDEMIEAARLKLADAKSATTAKLPGSAKFVRILQHPDGLHAVIVRVPGGMDARKYIAELRDAPDDPNMRMDASVLSFESRLLWPSVGTQEFVDLVDLFALAHRMVYPSELQKLAGFTGIDVKKKG